MVREVGRGAFSQVFEAVSEGNDSEERVALKIVSKENSRGNNGPDALNQGPCGVDPPSQGFEKLKDKNLEESTARFGKLDVDSFNSKASGAHSVSFKLTNDSSTTSGSSDSLLRRKPSNYSSQNEANSSNSLNRYFNEREQNPIQFNKKHSLSTNNMLSQIHHLQSGPKNIPASPSQELHKHSLANHTSIESIAPSISAQLDVETTLWSRLHHPYILEMTQVIHLEDATIIVSELASGGSMLEYVRMHGAPGLVEFTAQKLFNQLCSAVQYLHTEAGLIHRDIKCENILLDSNGNIKLCDFGLAIERIIIAQQKIEPHFVNRSNTIVRQHPKSCPGLCCTYPVSESSSLPTLHLSLPRKKTVVETQLAGSLHYTAPELLARQSQDASILHPTYTPKSDLWSLGCVLYAMLTGTLPFNDTFMPRLQLNIMNGRYNTERMKEYAAANEVVAGLLNVDPKLRWDGARVMMHPWVRGGE